VLERVFDLIQIKILKFKKKEKEGRRR